MIVSLGLLMLFLIIETEPRFLELKSIFFRSCFCCVKLIGILAAGNKGSLIIYIFKRSNIISSGLLVLTQRILILVQILSQN